MTKVTIPKADWDQHLIIAKHLQSQGMKASETVEWFRAYKYEVNGLRYEAVRVSAMIEGMWAVEPAITSDPVGIINAQLADGTLKYTKAKLVHTPKA